MDIDKWQQELNELWTRQEPLLPELEAYLGEWHGRIILEHPLVRDLFIDLERCGRINQAYKAKAAQAMQYLADGKYLGYILLYERPYRLEALTKIMGRLSDAGFWDLLGEVWKDSENIYQNRRAWRTLWSSRRPDREQCMNNDERIALAAMSDTFTVWRGTDHRSAVAGLSWTLNRNKAVWFAHRFCFGERRALLVEGEVSKRDVLAYFEGSGRVPFFRDGKIAYREIDPEREIVAAKVRNRVVSDVTDQPPLKGMR